MKSWPFAALLAVIAVAPIFYILYYFQSSSKEAATTANLIQFEPMNPPVVLEPGVVLPVKACSVLDGYRFELYTSGNKRIIAQLPAATKDQASQIVIDLLKTSGSSQQISAPTVTLLRQVEDFWIVDFYFTIDGNRERLLDILQERDLLLINGDTTIPERK